MKKFLYIIFIATSILNSQNIHIGIISSNTTVEPFGTPQLSNFRIEDANKDRVLFDASNDVTGMATTGFVVTNKTISSITIDGDGLGGYFTISSAFNYWDNSTVKLESGDGTVFDFKLKHIVNNIAEPTTSTNLYVEVGGSGTGTTIGDPMSITNAFSTATNNTTVWIKAGDYGTVNCSVGNNGTASNPIKFIGYKTTIGDDPGLTRSVGMSFDSTELPLLIGGSGVGIDGNEKDYIIIKNIQVEDYSSYHVHMTDSSFFVLENIYVEGSSTGMGIRFKKQNDTNIRVIDSYVANCYQVGLQSKGSHHLIMNTWVVSSKAVGGGGMDYYISVHGGDNGTNNTNIIVKDCYINRV